MEPEYRHLRDRRRVLRLLLLGLEQAHKLLEVCATVSGDESHAQTALAEAFGISEDDAMFLLALQVRRFTPYAVEQVRFELADLDRRLGDVDAP